MARYEGQEPAPCQQPRPETCHRDPDKAADTACRAPNLPMWQHFPQRTAAATWGSPCGRVDSAELSLPYESPLARRDGDLPLHKPFTGAILAWKLPGI